MLEASNIVQAYWLDRRWRRSSADRLRCDAYIRTAGRRDCGGTAFRLKIPLLGDALRKAETARFARAMGTLVANSVPLVQSHRHRRGDL